MKINVCLLCLLVISNTIVAQTHESIKTLASIGQYDKAKQEIDKVIGKPEFSSKAESYIQKAVIYSALGLEEIKKNSLHGDQLTNDADAAFVKYKQMDGSFNLLNDPLYQNAPLNLYSAFYTSGYNDYVAKKWDAALGKMKRAVEYSDLLIARKVLAATLDTNVLVLAGITAENSGKTDDAVIYYARLADNKMGGEGYETVYRYLLNYYFLKKNYNLFEKYKALGATVYPNSEFFKYDKVDYAVGLQTSFADQLIALETLLLTAPNDFKTNQVLGEIIYDQLNPREPKALPSNAADLEKKMINAFTKAAAAKPSFENPYIYIGDHFINKAVGDSVATTNCVAVDKAREPYEKAAAIFAAKTNFSVADKKQYKKVVSYLADIAACKKAKAKSGTPDVAKYAAEEKKWLDIYESIK